MPRIRSADAAEKRAAILGAAEDRLRTGGPAAVSVAAIARELGVAQNTVYWYFPSRDHLVVAALDRLLGEVLEQPRPAGEPMRRVLGLTDHLAPVWPLFTALYAGGRSEVVEDFLGRLDETLTAVLTEAFRELVAPRELAATVAVFRATVDGAFARGLEAPARRLVLRYAAARLTRDATRPPPDPAR